jgi:cold shock CspA family protein
MPTGTIKKLVVEKGFGFIRAEKGEGGSGDVFFHHSTVVDRGFDRLTEGQRVEYTLDTSNEAGKGPRAREVRPI